MAPGMRVYLWMESRHYRTWQASLGPAKEPATWSVTFFDSPSALGYRLASGDSEGRVIVWDIATATPVLVLEDPMVAAQSGSKGKGGAVRGLAWVCVHPARLAIVLTNGMFLVWDVQGTAPPLFSPVKLCSLSRQPDFLSCVRPLVTRALSSWRGQQCQGGSNWSMCTLCMHS